MSQPTLGIGAAARSLGTTERALRYYEERGLLSPSAVSPAGHRRYDGNALSRAKRLLALRNLGLTLSTIEEVLDPSTGTDLAVILTTQAQRLDDKIDDLLHLRRRVAEVMTAAPTSAVTDDTLSVLEELAMKIVLSRIYTRSGDDGTTALAGGVRVDKSDARVEVMGDVDELIATLGIAVAAAGGLHGELLLSIQNDLFDIGADLAGAVGSPEGRTPLVGPGYVERLEKSCDAINAELALPTSFVLPGSNPASAALHHARAVCRRAERHAWAAPETADDDCRYLNRLADLLFILARSAETEPEPTWVPGAHQPAKP